MSQYPGVYVVEIEGAVKPLPGVPTRIDEEDLRSIAACLRERLARYGPAWTDPDQHDPGATLVVAMAYLAEALADRTGPEARGRRLKFSRFLCGWRARLVRWIAA